MKKRDEIPDYYERSCRMGYMISAPVLPLADVALLLDMSLSTMDKIRADGKSPRCFKLGTRLYVRRADLLEWIDAMAISEAVPSTQQRSAVLAAFRRKA